MNQNMGSADRLFRGLVATPLLVFLGLMVGPGGWLAVLLYVVAAVMVGTAVAGSCPLYTLLGLRTCPLQRVDAGSPEHVGRR